MIRRLFPIAALMLAACSDRAPPPAEVPMLEFQDAWARATAAGQSSGAMYLTIVNRGGADDRLLGVTASRAGMVMVHATETLDGVSRMRMVRDLPIPARATVALAPGGTHIMLSGMKEPLVAGEQVDLVLRFEKAGTRKVAVTVNAPAAR